MNKLHKSFLKKHSWYSTWHKHPNHQVFQWLFLIVVVLGMTWLLSNRAQQVTQVNQNGINPLRSHAAEEAKFKQVKDPIPGQYIVVLKNVSKVGIDSKIADLNNQYQGRLKDTYKNAIQGFSTYMSEADAKALSSDPNVEYVSQDGKVAAASIQPNATWGISRIDNHNPYVNPLDTNYEYTATGQGVNIYVLDTGINTTHPDFNGRAFDAVNTSGDTTPVNQCNGHGTLVAGVAGSTTWGVAKNVKLYSVRVFPCWGSTSDSTVIAGVEWVTSHAARPAVANLSLGGGMSVTLDQAILASIATGITYVAAAGNDAVDACQYSPAHIPQVITVGMTTELDVRGNISNFGPCLDLFAPGQAIHSTGNMPNSPYEQLLSGTSIAAPHVAGVAALYLQTHPTALPAEVSQAIVSTATPNIISDTRDKTPNLMLYSRFQSKIVPGSGVPDSAAK